MSHWVEKTDGDGNVVRFKTYEKARPGHTKATNRPLSQKAKKAKRKRAAL